ncbi:unnamed protein product [Zymoseptoria tritici ST99CH_1A5]|nr:unnamed protein product [Zymoseptoria tritici ST99CH_1A5]
MTSLPTAYNPLETLLLFQALRVDGVASISFTRISDDLKNIPLIRDEPTYDPGRLSPDALRELYLGLLKEEVKQDNERQANGDSHTLTNGDASIGSKKRKIASPVLPTVQEAAKHSHLIPQLVSRLYARYKDNVVKKVREYEQSYATITADIGEIESGRRDEVLQRQHATSQVSSPNPSSIAHTQPSAIPSSIAHTQPSAIRHELNNSAAPSATASPAGTPRQGDAALQPPPKRYSQATIDAMMNHGPEPQENSDSHRRASSNTGLPPLSEMAPQSPRIGLPPKAHGSAQQQAYNQTPPPGQQSPYASHHSHSRQGSMPSPQLQQSLSRPSSSPRPILPPPPGMLPSSVPGQQHTGSPGMHHAPPLQPQQYYPQQSPQQHGQYHRMNTGQPLPNDQQPRYQAPLAAHTQGYHQQQTYSDPRAPYSPQHGQQPSAYQPQPPLQQSRQGGYMLAPFTLPAQDHHRPIQPQQNRSQYTPGQQQRSVSYSSQPNIGPATAPRGLPSQTSRLVSDVVSALATPPRPKVRPLWKVEYRPSPLQPSASTPRPEVEPLSPTIGRQKTPTRSGRGKRARDQPVTEETNAAEPPAKTRISKRRSNARAGSPQSVVSSAADESLLGRTRSHSVSTAVGLNASSDDRPGDTNGVKAEPSTPANMLEEGESTNAPSASSGTRLMTRKRRGTIQSQPIPPSKRKRQESPIEEDNEFGATPPPKGNTVAATRNFAKMSSAIMNDINSHKHAAYFATAVREKNAPGYNDIIHQPQNLKSIRTAITAGTKAVAAAAAALESAAESSARAADGSTTVELERTADLEPPKAIVNGVQLEKELMRMFANAYMFNPGEDGMALSTKEFFHDVEQKISDWRSTEREAGGEDDEEGKSKRRKA